MHSSARYRQPAQARAFGTGGILLLVAMCALLMSIRLIQPPASAIDAGREVTFVVKSIPKESSAPPSTPDASPPSEMPPPAPPALQISPGVVPVQASATNDAGKSAAGPVAITVPTMPPALASSASGAVSPEPRPSASAGPSASVLADWRARVLEHLKRHRRYPRQAANARQQGVARVAITVRRSGEVAAVELVRGSGYPMLDMEARATVRRASPLPAPDDTLAVDTIIIEVPVDFSIGR